VRERSDRAVAAPGSSGGLVARGRGTRWPWLIVAIAVGAVKVEAYASLLHDRTGVIFVLAVGLLVAFLRAKPVAIAVFAAGILGFALALHPLLAGVALGVGAFVLLIALFFAISTVLHARQRRRWPVSAA
jgi:hypothetical protein